MALAQVTGQDRADGIVRLLSVAFRRYAREPESRNASARLILGAAVALYAERFSAADAALAAAESVAELGRAERQDARRDCAVLSGGGGNSGQ